ncbi:MAG: Vitamin B12 transporter BtuB [Opitutia bacterium UBA7350]|nr:MAG: Vitamin B12 transporter BtuB [Opitutae bacterium UBA7350]
MKFWKTSKTTLVVGCISFLFDMASLKAIPETDPAIEYTLEPFIVVSTRTPIPLERVSPSVAYVDLETIQHWQDFYLTDVLTRQPGINLKANGGKGAVASLFLRGANSDQTALFLDGRRMNRTMSGQYDLEFLNVDNLSSVQILKGASSVNYGSSGIGGVIDLQSQNTLGQSTRKGALNLEVGSHAFHKANLAYQISNQDWGMSFSHSEIETDNERANDTLVSSATNFRLDAHINHNLTAEFLGQYAENDKGIPGKTSNPTLKEFTESKSWLLSPGLRYENNNYEVHVFYSREFFRLDHTYNYGGQDKSRLTTDEFNLQIDYEGFDRLTLSLGTLHRKERIRKPGSYQKSIHQSGVFSQALWQLRESLELRGGLRYDTFNLYQNDWSWNLEAIYFVPDTNLSIFTKIARAYAPPTGQDLAYDENRDSNNNLLDTSLNPEESLSFEIGLRQKLLDEKLKWTAVLFHNEIENLIQYVSYPTLPGPFYPSDTFNAREATLEGLEISVDYSLNKQLDFSFGYTLLTALADKYISANAHYEVIRLPYRPRQLLQFTTRYQASKNLNLGLSAVGQIDRQRDQWQDYNLPMKDFFVLNFVTDYQVSESISIFARVENLLDKDYALSYEYPTLGRSLYLGARLKF